MDGISSIQDGSNPDDQSLALSRVRRFLGPRQPGRQVPLHPGLNRLAGPQRPSGRREAEAES